MTALMRDIHSPAVQARAIFCKQLDAICAFKVIVGSIHEAGHLVQTYVGLGQQPTPNWAAVTRPRHPNEIDMGEWWERNIFGGSIDFHQDDIDALGRTPVGYPWFYPDDAADPYAHRIDITSIVAITKGDAVQLGNPLLTLTDMVRLIPVAGQPAILPVVSQPMSPTVRTAYVRDVPAQVPSYAGESASESAMARLR